MVDEGGVRVGGKAASRETQKAEVEGRGGGLLPSGDNEAVKEGEGASRGGRVEESEELWESVHVAAFVHGAIILEKNCQCQPPAPPLVQLHEVVVYLGILLGGQRPVEGVRISSQQHPCFIIVAYTITVVACSASRIHRCGFISDCTCYPVLAATPPPPPAVPASYVGKARIPDCTCCPLLVATHPPPLPTPPAYTDVASIPGSACYPRLLLLQAAEPPPTLAARDAASLPGLT
ncbi:hypothetical protein GOP47_0028615 [Adiantum capillus-veneris]|nr:hypothetical protein GOP47_0028615 [Adiantum capillus-veneris]